MKFQKYFPLMLAIIMLVMPTLVHAQGPDPGSDPDAAVPIDGGLSLLLAAGVGYVAKKGYDSRKKKTSNDKLTQE